MYTWEISREKTIIRGGLEFRLKYHLQLKTEEERYVRGRR